MPGPGPDRNGARPCCVLGSDDRRDRRLATGVGLAPETPQPEWESTKEDLLPYLRRLIVTVIVIGVALLLWQLREVLLLAFAAVLVAVILLSLTKMVQRVTGLGHRVSLVIAGL